MVKESSARPSLYTMHLDADGYPLMSGGIRANDPEFLKEVFQNLGRYQKDDKFTLCTQVEGKDILVSSFDDALVAQEIVVHTSSCIWKFLGALQFEVPLDELRVDEWERFHAYVGPSRIPAVMSHKAQAAFLQNFPNLESLHPKAYRSTHDSLDSSRWDKPYQSNEMPWDMGRLSPVIEFHSKQMLEKSGKAFLIPGAGGGHEVPFLERAGKKVTALDFSPTAKEVFLKNYPLSKANYVVGDFFKEKLPPFDAILELAFFVALDPSVRPKIV